MNLGGERDPAWALNLQDDPRATIAIAGLSIEVVARKMTGAEWQRAWARWLELQPSARAFRELAGREIPLFPFQPSGRGSREPGHIPPNAA